MIGWLAALLVGAGAAALSYRWDQSRRYWLPAALRTLSFVIAIALVLDLPLGVAHPPPALVVLDGSSSWTRARGVDAWTRAARAAGAGAMLAGDSLRSAAAIPDRPTDAASRLRPAAERALAEGRPLRAITDGEVDDADALRSLPAGSRIEVFADSSPRPDGAVASIESAPVAAGGDTIVARIGLIAGGAGAGAGRLTLRLDGNAVASVPVAALPAWGERDVELRATAPSRRGTVILSAALSTAGDAEPRNDTAFVAIAISEAPAAVFVSTAPDEDSRFALAALRGAVSLPARAFVRVAPGVWRVEGTLAPATEDEVRRALRSAPLAVIHGDTALFGAPLAATTGALALIAPPAAGESGEGEFYAVSAPPSPLAPALGDAPWDSLAPLDVAAAPPGEWEGLETRRGRRLERRIAVTGAEKPRRTVRVTAAGLWRWRFRGGAAAGAFDALWGGIFDWLAAEPRGGNGLAPVFGVVREGEPVRWRRGNADSVLALTLVKRGAGRAPGPTTPVIRTVRWHGSESLAESAPLAAGIYDVQVPTGSSVLVVNASRELLPRRPTLRSGDVGGVAAAGDPPRARDATWLIALVIAALCAEWLLRRRLGLR